MEFHCSLPIKPSRAQTILYGDTLEDYLVGEQISYALYSKVRNTPQIVLTDLMPVLALRRICPTPVACLDIRSDSANESQAESGKFSLELPVGAQQLKVTKFALNDSQLAVSVDFASDIRVIEDVWQKLSPQFNLVEPFDRIVEALREANPTSKAA